MATSSNYEDSVEPVSDTLFVKSSTSAEKNKPKRAGLLSNFLSKAKGKSRTQHVPKDDSNSTGVEAGEKESSPALTCLFETKNQRQNSASSSNSKISDADRAVIMKNLDQQIDRGLCIATMGRERKVPSEKQQEFVGKNVQCKSLDRNNKVAYNFGGVVQKKSSKSLFLRKLLKKPAEFNEKQLTVAEGTNTDAQNLNENCSLRNTEQKVGDASPSFTSNLSAFMYPSCSAGNVSCGLKEIMEFSLILQSNQSHLIQILSKYVKDTKLEKELVDAVSGHAKIQIEIERRAQATAQDMWLEQVEIYKKQERTLQDSLKEMVRQNRKLQEENDVLMKKNDKMLSKMALTQDDGSTCAHGRGNLHIIDHLNRSNEKLRYKVNTTIHQIEYMEENLLKEQKRNEELEEKQQELFSQIQHLKANFQSGKIDYELEHASLSHRLAIGEGVIKESIEAGDVLLEDLENIKRQFASTFCTIDWKKPTGNGNTLTELIHISRSCINELSREVLVIHNQLVQKNQESESFKQENQKLQQVIYEMEHKLQTLIQEADIIKDIASEKSTYSNKISALETTLEKYQETVEVQQDQAADRHALLNKAKEEIVSLVEQMALKEVELSNLKKEKDALLFQVKGLDQILKASGAGEVARELALSQEKMSMLQSIYYQVENERNCVMDKMTTLNSEIRLLQENDSKYCEKIRQQNEEVESLKAANFELKESFTKQQATILALQNERVRHLAEKNFLKTVYDKLKEDIGRIEKLEGSLNSINKEATRLAVIAEFNKQLGEKLQSEVAERDVIITDLQNDVKKLNDIHKESTRDKVALCEELTEVCTIKELLNSKLEAEIKKSAELDETKKVIESTTSEQLESLKEMQNLERSAIKELLTDFNCVVDQRDEFYLKLQNDVAEIERLQTENKNLNEKLDEASKSSFERENKIKALEFRLVENEELMKNFASKLAEAQTNENLTLIAEKDEVKKETEKLENSIEYLQANLKKLQADLDSSRQAENVMNESLQDEMKRLNQLQVQYNEQGFALKLSQKESVRLTKQVENLKEQCTKKDEEYAALVEETTQAQNFVREEMEQTKAVLTESDKEMQKLLNAIEEKNWELETLENKFIEIEQENNKMRKSLEHITSEERKIKEDMFELVAERGTSKMKVTALADELQLTKTKLASAQKKYDSQKLIHQNKLAEVSANYDKQIDELQVELRALKVQMVKIGEDQGKEKTAYTTLEEAHKDLAAKLLRSVHMLIDEKLARQTCDSKINDLMQKVVTIESEKMTVVQKLEIANEDLQVYKNKAAEIMKEKESLDTNLKDLKEQCNEMHEKYNYMEKQLHESKQKYKSFGKMKSNSSLGETNDRYRQKLRASEDRIEELKAELVSCHDYVLELQNEIGKLQQNHALLEFEKREADIQLQDAQMKLDTSNNLNEDLKSVSKRILSVVFEMRDNGSISRTVCDALVEESKFLSTNAFTFAVMEHLSSAQLEKYEKIIKKIEDEHENHKALTKKVEQLNSKITATGISIRKDIASKCIYKCSLKIFTSPMHACKKFTAKFPKEQLDNLLTCPDSKFYYVEVYISLMHQDKIVNQNWVLNVCVRNSKTCVNASADIKNRIVNPVTFVVPFDDSTEEATVDVSALWYSDADDAWPYVKVASIPVDVSYHFEPQLDASSDRSTSGSVIRIARQYNAEIQKSVFRLPLVECVMPWKCRGAGLFEYVAQHCYHNVDFRKDSHVVRTNDGVVFTFSAGNADRITLEHRTKEESLLIKAPVEVMRQLKNYLQGNQRQDKFTLQQSTSVLSTIRESLEYMMKQGEKDDDISFINPNVLLDAYADLRRLILFV